MKSTLSLLIVICGILVYYFSFPYSPTGANIFGGISALAAFFMFFMDRRERLRNEEKERAYEKRIFSLEIQGLVNERRLDPIVNERLFFQAEGLERNNELNSAIDILIRLLNTENLTIEGNAILRFKIALNYQIMSDTSNAVVYYEQSLKYVEQIADEQIRLNLHAPIYLNLAKIQNASFQNLILAEKYYQLAHLSYQKLGDHPGSALAAMGLGAILQTKGDIKNALILTDEAIDFFRKTQDIKNLSVVLNNKGIIYRDLGNDKKAIRFYIEALNAAQKTGEVLGLADINKELGVAFRNIGDLSKSKDYLNKALKLYQSINRENEVGYCYGNLGIIEAQNGNNLEAKKYYELALELFQKNNDSNGIGNELCNIGNCYNTDGEFEKAIYYISRALTFHQKIDYKLGIAYDLRALAVVHWNLGNKENSLAHFQNSIRTFELIGNDMEVKMTRELIEKII